MAKKKKKKKGNVVLNIFIAAVFLTGAGIFLYPTFSDMWNQYRNAKLISKYELAGVAEWKLGFENSGIWSVITENLS